MSRLANPQRIGRTKVSWILLALRRSALGALITVMLVAPGCGSSNDDNGTTGAGASGGSGASTGASSTGGTGGVTSTSAASGETTSSGSGGSGATGGSAPCTVEQYTHSFEFGAIFEGWEISTYSSPSLVPMTPMGSGGASSGASAGGTAGESTDAEGGAGNEGGESPSGEGGESSGPAVSGTLIELDTSEGAPDSPDGSLKLTIPFDGPGQLLLLGRLFNTGLNFIGTTVTARIKLDSGLIVGPSDTGSANLVLKTTGAYIYDAGPAVVMDPSAGWVTLTIDPDAPSVAAASSGHYACDVREIDIEIRTGDTGSYQQAVVHIDSIAVTPDAE